MARMSRRTRAGAAVAAGLLAGTALAGCGDEEDRSAADRVKEGSSQAGGRQDAAEVVRTAHERTVAAETARMTLRIHAASGGRERTVTGSGSVDLADGTSDLTVRAGGETVRQRVVGRVLYQELPESLRDRVSDGRPWIRIDLREAAGRIEGVSGLRLGDPARVLGYAGALSEDPDDPDGPDDPADSDDPDGPDDGITRIGREKVAGADTTRYRVTVDVEDLADEDTAQGERLRRQLGESLPMDLWLDDRNRIRRQQFEIDARGAGSPPADTREPREPGDPAQAGNATVRTVLEFHDFGTPVDVSAPPAGQTTDVTDRFVRPSGESPGG
ncbi:hypothetical protein GCM10010420_02340 [Streptomyces glaucosporus]|uniref:Lipoprotein n=1 Tax=Streptomyces glaucosporus TaxID=284044 RepID=A0ABN3HM50_9ACTN